MQCAERTQDRDASDGVNDAPPSARDPADVGNRHGKSADVAMESAGHNPACEVILDGTIVRARKLARATSANIKQNPCSPPSPRTSLVCRIARTATSPSPPAALADDRSGGESRPSFRLTRTPLTARGSISDARDSSCKRLNTSYRTKLEWKPDNTENTLGRADPESAHALLAQSPACRSGASRRTGDPMC